MNEEADHNQNKSFLTDKACHHIPVRWSHGFYFWLPCLIPGYHTLFLSTISSIRDVCLHVWPCGDAYSSSDGIIRRPVLESRSVLMWTSFATAALAWSPTSCISPGSQSFNIWFFPWLPWTLILACSIKSAIQGKMGHG